MTDAAGARSSREQPAPSGNDCVFCAIVAGRLTASIVAEDALTIAFVDLRQFHAGHVLIIPRAHVTDIRDANDTIVSAVARMAARVARAVDRVFPSDGMNIWHSAGRGANQEVPHLHFHVHPRLVGDDVLRVYPRPPSLPDRATLDSWAAQLRERMSPHDTNGGVTALKNGLDE